MRIIAELALNRRPMSKAQAFWINTMEKVGQGKDLIKWLDEGSVKSGTVGSRIKIAPVHIAESTRQNVKEAHPRVHTLFVLCGLTGHLQPCDLAFCQHFKQQVGGLCTLRSW